MSKMALSADVLQMWIEHVRACPRTLPKASQRQDTGRPKVYHFKSLQEPRLRSESVSWRLMGHGYPPSFLCFVEFVAPESQNMQKKQKLAKDALNAAETIHQVTLC